MKKIVIYFFAAIIAFLIGYYLNYFEYGNLGVKFEKVLEWEGRVDGLDILKVKGRKLFVEHIKDKKIVGMKYKFFKNVGKGNYFIRKDRGRGIVSVYQFPLKMNNFYLSIMLDDTDFGGDGIYKFSLFQICRKSGGENRKEEKEIFGWSGIVDKKEILEVDFNLRDVAYIHLAGSREIRGDKYFFLERFKIDKNDSIFLKKVFGRGAVDIVDIWENKVRVSIFDPYRGPSLYEFVLYVKR